MDYAQVNISEKLKQRKISKKSEKSVRKVRGILAV